MVVTTLLPTVAHFCVVVVAFWLGHFRVKREWVVEVLLDDTATARIDWGRAAEWLSHSYGSPRTWVWAFVVAAVFVGGVLVLAEAVGLDLVRWLYWVCVQAIDAGEAFGGWLRGGG